MASYEGSSKRVYGPQCSHRTFVLLFDGTGNRFSGTESDSNVLKILRMLSQTDPNQVYYYQPGIGTYIQSTNYHHTSSWSRVKSWLKKTQDMAIGTSFDEHVMAGYKFLMRYYTAGDDIFFFGFSRGAYIARFLAKMIDGVGLLGPGQEEMSRFAWKAFAQWEMRLDGTKEEKAKKAEMLKYLIAFRDTFSRPVKRIKFLGLFDTVNSVPQFESAWLQRSKFPYTARSSALTIRHAVAIDERRAKFRQDLLGEVKQGSSHGATVRRGRPLERSLEDHLGLPERDATPHREGSEISERYKRPNHTNHRSLSVQRSRVNSMSPARSSVAATDRSGLTAGSQISIPLRRGTGGGGDDEDDDEDTPQDIQEVWFPGAHADIGGGWPLHPGETIPLSHAPLAWIVREAAKAGLNFDQDKMRELKIDLTDDYDEGGEIRLDRGGAIVPEVHVTSDSPDRERTADTDPGENRQSQRSKFHESLHLAATKGIIHDCLERGPGRTLASVLTWKLMEHLPFRRMDLQPDNSWKSIRWPLPRGEVRDIPDSAWIHSSALRRMEADETYRPGNLIIGGGGRGVHTAPKEYGMGEWDPLHDTGDPVGECVIRRKKANAEAETNGESNGHEKKKKKAKGEAETNGDSNGHKRQKKKIN